MSGGQSADCVKLGDSAGVVMAGWVASHDRYSVVPAVPGADYFVGGGRMSLLRVATYVLFAMFWFGTGIYGWDKIPAVYVASCFVSGIFCASFAVSFGGRDEN